MALDFTYTVLKVNTETHTMEVQYSTVGQEIVTMSMMIPYADQDLIQYISNNAPQAKWTNASKTYHSVQVGTSGTFVQPAPSTSNSMLGNITDAQLEAAIQRVLDRNAEGTV